MVILDTHYFIWDTLGHLRMTNQVNAFLDEQKYLWLSSISFWEIAILMSKGKIKLSVSIEEFYEIAMLKRNYQILSIDARVSDVVRQLPRGINGDPADRIISAKAIFYDALLLTADNNLINSPVIKTVHFDSAQ